MTWVAPFAFALIAVVGWAVVRWWVPGGSLRPGFELAASRSGLSRRAIRWGSALFAVPAAGSLLWLGLDGVGLVWAVAVGLYGGGIVLVAVAASNRPRYRAVTADRTPAGRVTGGRVVVSGTVRAAEETLRTPFTGTEAVCVQWSIDQYAENLRGGGAWFTVDWGRERTPFYVEDDSGEVLVDPADCWLALAPANDPASPPDRAAAFEGGAADRELRVDAGEAAPERVRAFCAEHTRFDPADGASRETTFAEQTLEPGDEVVVVGTAMPSPGGYAATVVTGADPRKCFVAAGSLESVRRELRRTVSRGRRVGWAVAIAGVVALLAAAIGL